MKRFIFSMLAVSIFFAGVGSLVERAGARFRSDERAVALIQQARQALGGDGAIAGIQSMRIVGQTTRTMTVNGTSRTDTGETELAMMLPDKFMKTIKIGHDDGAAGDKMVRKIELVTVGDDKPGKEMTVTADGDSAGSGVKHIIIKRPDGTVRELTGAEAEKAVVSDVGSAGKTTANGEHQIMIRKMDAEAVDRRRHNNEMLRLTLGLLLTPPPGLDVSYNFGGEGDVDGTPCNIVVADVGGSAYRIYLGRSSNLPVMLAFTGIRMPNIMFFKKEAGAAEPDTKDKMVFTQKVDGPGEDTAEFQIKFADFRSVNGVQLPYKWTQIVGGATDEVFDVTSYDINPANIAEKFEHPKGMVMRTAKPAGE